MGNYVAFKPGGDKIILHSEITLAAVRRTDGLWEHRAENEDKNLKERRWWLGLVREAVLEKEKVVSLWIFLGVESDRIYSGFDLSEKTRI